jgi:hypothetical protein
MDSRKYIFLMLLFSLLVPQIACCEEYGSQTNDTPEDIIDDFYALFQNHLFEVRDYVHTEECYDCYDLSGDGIAIGIWEALGDYNSSKIDESKSDFNGRVHIMDTYADSSPHATAVALILGANSSDNADWGMAPEIEMYSFDDFEAYYEMIYSSMDITTHSYGEKHPSTFGLYTTKGNTSSILFDRAIRDNELITFGSAGNEFDDDGYVSITAPATAKNIITVGATKSDFFNDMAAFSSAGPTKDGRLKPEIVAPGDDLSLGVFGYYFNRGVTSYSCPAASGSSALILEHWKNTHPGEDMLPSTMKALLVHTANNDGNGPTYRYGYGMLDTKEAVDLVQLDTNESITIIQDSSSFDNSGLQYSNLSIPVPDNTGELKVTLAWSDKEGLFDTDVPLYNDLDLVIGKDHNPSSTTYYYP